MKVQTRRTVSLMGCTYLRLAALAQHRDSDRPNVAGTLEALIAAECERLGIPEVSREEATTTAKNKAARKLAATALARFHGGGVFSF